MSIEELYSDPEGQFKQLPEELTNLRRELALKRIMALSSAAKAQQALQEAKDVIDKYPDMSTEDKNELKTVLDQNPDTMGKLLASGVSAIAAPLLLQTTDAPPVLKFLSVPAAALGAASFYDFIKSQGSKPRHNFIPVLPRRVRTNPYRGIL